MPAFSYQALDKKGYAKKGLLEGDTARHIRQQLRAQGLTPLHVEEVNQPAVHRRRPRRLSISVADLSLFTRQLATLLASGVPLEESLRVIARQTEKNRLKSLLLAIHSRILEGRALAEGLSDFPHAFPAFYQATVAAGEQAGHLDLTLERLADYTENYAYLRQKMLLTLLYPLLLSVVALGVVTGLLMYVVPQVTELFASTQQQLPLLTTILIGLSVFLKNWGSWLFAGLLIFIVSIRGLLRFEKVVYFFHHLMLKMPLAARLERGTNTARFTRTLSILIASGVPLLESLHITAQILHNLHMRRAVLAAANKVREGSSLHAALENTALFPPIALHLIASGETSGNLSKMLERAALHQERELEAITKTLLQLLEPLLILVLGGVVLLIVLAILLPIFELNQLVK